MEPKAKCASHGKLNIAAQPRCVMAAAAFVVAVLVSIAALVGCFCVVAFGIYECVARYPLMSTMHVVGLIVLIPVMIVLLIRTLVQNPPLEEGRPDLPIKQAEYPEVHALVHRVFDAVGSAPPSNITVSCQVSCSMNTQCWAGNLWVLEIGLPFVAGATESHLAGVIAHEAGHLRCLGAQRVLNLGSNAIEIVARASGIHYVEERFAARLRSAGPVGWIALALLFVGQLGAFVLRLVIAPSIKLADAVGCALSLEVEYRADAYAAAVVGGHEFATALKGFRRMMHLEFVLDRTRGHLAKSIGLPDDEVRFVTHMNQNLHKAFSDMLDGEVKRRDLGVFTTHPPDEHRMQRVQSCKEKRVLVGDRPATDLFKDFAALCRSATMAGDKSDSEGPRRMPVEELLEITSAEVGGTYGYLLEAVSEEDLAFSEGDSTEPG